MTDPVETSGQGLHGVGVAAEPHPGSAPSSGALWRSRSFMTFWTGQAFAQFGGQITELALPVLAVLLLDATEFEVGVLNAAGVAAFLIVGLPAGAWIDRMRKRHVMIVADAVRAVALAMLPLLWFLGVLQVWHLVVVALVMGVATVFFDVSYQSIVPSLVAPERIPDANGKLESTAQLAGIAGPAAGGWLVAAITAPFAILATVATYVVSLVALLLTRDREVVPERHEHAPLGRSIAEGLRWVFANRYLRRIVPAVAISNFFGTIMFTLLPILLLRELGFTPELVGLIFGLSALGGFLGAVATPWIVRAVGEARAIPIASLAFTLVGFAIPAAAAVPHMAFPILVVQGFLMSFSVLLFNITQVSFRQRITPPRLLGRMNASIRFCVRGVMPIAALLAGGLGTWIGTVPTMWIGAVGSLLSILPVVIGPFWTMRELSSPEHVERPPARGGLPGDSA